MLLVGTLMGYVAAARKRSHQRRDLTSSSYTTDINTGVSVSFALKNQKAARLIFELLAVETINYVVSEGSIAFTEVSYAKAVSYCIRK